MGSSAADLTSRLLRHERVLLTVSILVLALLSWTFLIGNVGMGAMQPPLAALVSMWWVMMVAMMLPSATPAILLYARVRHSRSGGAAIAPPWIFLCGYLAVWLLFSIAAAFAQRSLMGASLALQGHFEQGCTTHRCGRLSALTDEVGLRQPVPLARAFYQPLLAAWLDRRRETRGHPRRFLCRLLLDADGAAVRRRGNESPVGRGAGGPCGR